MLAKFFSFLIPLLCFPAILGTGAGILRATLGLSFDSASALAVLPSFLAILFIRKIPPPKCSVGAIAAVLLLFLLERNFFSLATVGNADSGLHLERLIDFVTKNPDEYHGFISYYATAEIFHRYLSFNYLWATVLPLYLSALVLFALILPNKESSEAWIAYGARVIPALAIAFVIVFQFMAQGAFAHVWAMPLTVLIFRLATWQGISEISRCIALAISLIALRYSYGLNLADYLFYFAALLFISPWPRKIRIPLALLVLAASLLAYVNIWEVLRLAGARTNISLGLVWLGFGLSALMAFCLLLKREENKRVWISVLVMSVLTICIQVLYWQTGGRLLYYGMKYPMCAILLLAAALTSFSWQSRRLPAALSCLLLLYFLAFPLRPYLGQMLFSEFRVPLISPKSFSAIESHLEKEKKAFGGYLTPNWPAAKFVGAAFGFRQSIEYREGALKEGKDHCIFWEASPGRFHEMQRVMRIVHGQADRVMSHYRRLYSTPSTEYSVGLLAHGELAYLCR